MQMLFVSYGISPDQPRECDSSRSSEALSTPLGMTRYTAPAGPNAYKSTCLEAGLGFLIWPEGSRNKCLQGLFNLRVQKTKTQFLEPLGKCLLSCEHHGAKFAKNRLQQPTGDGR
jgi:hypothetical protein